VKDGKRNQRSALGGTRTTTRFLPKGGGKLGRSTKKEGRRYKQTRKKIDLEGNPIDKVPSRKTKKLSVNTKEQGERIKGSGPKIMVNKFRTNEYLGRGSKKL